MGKHCFSSRTQMLKRVAWTPCLQTENGLATVVRRQSKQRRNCWHAFHAVSVCLQSVLRFCGTWRDPCSKFVRQFPYSAQSWLGKFRMLRMQYLPHLDTFNSRDNYKRFLLTLGFYYSWPRQSLVYARALAISICDA